MTCNEELVLSLTDQNRLTRGHVKVIGLGDVSTEDAMELVQQEIPDVTRDEAKMIVNKFGGFIHDIKGCSRAIQDRLGLANMDNTTSDADATTTTTTRAKIFDQVIEARYKLLYDHVSAVFVKGIDIEGIDNSGGVNFESSGEAGGGVGSDGGDAFLDPLKEQYSEYQASQNDLDQVGEAESASYSQLQMWKTLQKLVESKDGTEEYRLLVDEVFNGDQTPILELMDEDILTFDYDNQDSNESSWKVKAASPAVASIFKDITNYGYLKDKYDAVEQNEENHNLMRNIIQERQKLAKEITFLEQRKKALLNTVELGEKLGRKMSFLGIFRPRNSLSDLYSSFVKEEREAMARDRELRQMLKDLEANENDAIENDSKSVLELGLDLKTALRDLMDQKTDQENNNKVTDLQALFKILDSTNDGKVDADEIAFHLGDKFKIDVDRDTVDELLQKWDDNRDGSIDFEEFKKMLKHLGIADDE